ncbi:MAG TPA: hypothetical protein VGW74_04690 [Propionibacteriaceae bacterium]|nr:hypothetical protein [Propionibacteriaceae bacterium]
MTGDWTHAVERRATAWHEAGHAVAATALGLAVRYVTLRSRNGGGQTTYRETLPPAWGWRAAGAVHLAGMAGEQLLHTDRAVLIHGGYYDLRNARLVARAAIDVRDHPADDSGRPRRLADAKTGGWAEWLDAAKAMDPAWSERDVGALMWRHAVDTVTEHLDAVAWVAGLLLTSPRAVPGRQVREVFAASERSSEPPAVDDVEWWIPRHTRMQWRRTSVCSAEVAA